MTQNRGDCLDSEERCEARGKVPQRRCIQEGQEEAQDLSVGCGTWDKELPILLFVRRDDLSSEPCALSKQSLSKDGDLVRLGQTP